MIVVVDASAAVKLVLDEDDSDIARRVWDEAAAVVAPTVVLPEVAAAISAASRAQRIDDRATTSAHAAWRELANMLDLRVVDEGLSEAARRIAQSAAVRGMDAIYLAAVQELHGQESPAALLSFDVRQRGAAMATGVDLMPA